MRPFPRKHTFKDEGLSKHAQTLLFILNDCASLFSVSVDVELHARHRGKKKFSQVSVYLVSVYLVSVYLVNVPGKFAPFLTVSPPSIRSTRMPRSKRILKVRK